MFIAPETGVYVFTWTMREASDCTHSTQLMVNTTEIGIIRLQSVTGGDFVGTGVVVTHMQEMMFMLERMLHGIIVILLAI